MVKQFERGDYEEISNWYEKWGSPTPPYDSLPTNGLIRKGIAAGFLVTTDSSVGILDFYISNRFADRNERNKTLDEITKRLIALGLRQGLKYFKCDTQIDAIKDRAKKHGFKHIGEFSSYFIQVKE